MALRLTLMHWGVSFNMNFGGFKTYKRSIATLYVILFPLRMGVGRQGFAATITALSSDPYSSTILTKRSCQALFEESYRKTLTVPNSIMFPFLDQLLLLQTTCVVNSLC